MAFKLLDQLERHAIEIGYRCAFKEVGAVGQGRALSWEQLRAAARGVGAWTASHLKSEETVLLACPNVCEFPAAFLGVLSAGNTIFPVSNEMTALELMTAAAQSSARAVIGTAAACAALAGHITNCFPVDEVLSHSENKAYSANQANGGLLLQSSGTTGLPKIVRRSLASLDAVSSNMSDAIGFDRSDSVLATVPLCHSYGLEHGLLGPIWGGSTVHLCRGLDLSVVVKQLRVGGITILPGVPSMFEMLGAIGDEPHDMPTLRRAYSAGARLPKSIANRFYLRHGARVGQVYGATEFGSVTFNDASDIARSPESVGGPMKGVRIEIRDPFDPGRCVKPGEEGQVCVIARSMFNGYVGESNRDANAWYPTGDLGRIDEQDNLFITGRLTLLIDVGGLKVNPMEVEEVLLRHPSVGACVVLPIRLSETVFRIKAIVTPKNSDSPPDPIELRRFVRERLSAYKVPRLIEVRDALPRSATGKVLRHLVEAR